MQNTKAIKKRIDNILFLSADLLWAKGKKKMKKPYPSIPQIGIGMPKKIENGLCETVSQLIDCEIAQKLS